MAYPNVLDPSNVTRVGNEYSGGNVTGNVTINGQRPGGNFIQPGGIAERAMAAGVPRGAASLAQSAVTQPGAQGASAAQSGPMERASALVMANPLAARALTQPPTPAPMTGGMSIVEAAGVTPGGGTSGNVTKTVGPDGRVSYSGGPNISGDITVNGKAPGGGFMVADSLASRALAQAPAQTAPQGFAAPTIQHSGNSWQAANNLRNARVSASSITQSDKWGKGGDRTATANYQALLSTDQALQKAQPGMAKAALDASAGLRREVMQQTGANQRTIIQALAEEDRARQTVQQQATQNDLARQRLALDTARASRDGVPSGYRPKADGTLEAIPGGPADPGTPKGTLNEGQAKALAFGARMQQSGQNLDALAAQGVTQPGYIKRMADTVGAGALMNWTQNDGQQRVEQSQRDFVNAVLRKESGAAISNSEFDNARRQYFAQPGDSQAVIEQKRQNRELATRGMLAEVPNSQNRVQQVRGAGQTQQPQQGQQRTVARTGTMNGRRVVQYSDGSINYAD